MCNRLNQVGNWLCETKWLAKDGVEESGEWQKLGRYWTTFKSYGQRSSSFVAMCMLDWLASIDGNQLKCKCTMWIGRIAMTTNATASIRAENALDQTHTVIIIISIGERIMSCKPYSTLPRSHTHIKLCRDEQFTLHATQANRANCISQTSRLTKKKLCRRAAPTKAQTKGKEGKSCSIILTLNRIDINWIT